MKRLFVFLLCLLLYPWLLRAQSGLRGVVRDPAQLPVGCAAIRVSTLPDSILLAVARTDSQGHFSIAAPGKQLLLLQVVSPGYAAYQTLAGPFPDTIQSLEITFDPDEHLLQGIAVTASKPIFTRKSDRIVFNVAQSTSAIGADAFELLKKAPGVQVSNSTINMTGKGTVSVMVNDRLQQVSGEELEALLRAVPADQVQAIEIISTPPAKYEAEGNAGMINIITKKMSLNGFNGTVTTAYQQRVLASGRFSGSFNYRKEKWNVYGNANINRFNFTAPQQTIADYPEQRQEQANAQLNHPLYSRNQLGIDYAFSKQSVIGLLYTFGSADRYMDQGFRTNVYGLPANRIDSVLQTNAHTSDQARRNVINLNYEWKLDSSGRKLVLNADYFDRQSELQRNFNTQHYLPSGTPLFLHQDNKTSGRQSVAISALRADYTWPLKIATVNMGAKASFVRNNSDNRFMYLDGAAYSTDPDRTNIFEYTEHIQAAYLSAAKEYRKWEWQAGLRAEYTQTKGISDRPAQVNTNHYFKLFPSVSLLYRFNEQQSATLSYNRRIERPDFYVMNPFREYSTPTSYESGNPFLQPSFSDNINLAYTFHTDYTAGLFVEQVQQPWSQVSVIDPVLHAFNFTMANVGKSVRYGVYITADIQPLPCWELNAEGHATFNHYKGMLDGVSYNTKTNVLYTFEVNNTIALNKGKTLVAELGFNYTSDGQIDFARKQYAWSSLDAGIKALLCDKKCTLAITGSDLFRQDKWYVMNRYNGTVQRGYFDSRVLSLAFSWKFGNDTIKAKRERNDATEETKRAG